VPAVAGKCPWLKGKTVSAAVQDFSAAVQGFYAAVLNAPTDSLQRLVRKCMAQARWATQGRCFGDVMAELRTLRGGVAGPSSGHRRDKCVHTGLRYSPSRKLRSERCLTPRSSAWMGSMLTANPLCVCPSSLTIQGSWIMIFPEYDSNLISLRIKQPFYRSIVI